MEREGSFRRSLQNKLRLGLGSSSSLTDLSQAKTPGVGGGERGGTTGGPADECNRHIGTQQRRAGANATWNGIHNAVISVFQRKDLGENELYTLNEGVRQLLKTELGCFFTEYLQNQLLTKGMVILRDKIHFYEGQKLLDSLADTWDFFFCDVLSMLQAIFYPVQGKEPSVRQMALLHFRNIITLNLKLDEALCRPRARVPPSIIQMLLLLQGVHESKGVTDDYLRLEALIQKVVSPYLGTHGLHSRDGSSNLHCSSCLLGTYIKPLPSLLAVQTRKPAHPQEPSGPLQELQRAHADPCGGVRLRLFRGRGRRHQAPLGLRDDLLPGGEQLFGRIHTGRAQRLRRHRRVQRSAPRRLRCPLRSRPAPATESLPLPPPRAFAGRGHAPLWLAGVRLSRVVPGPGHGLRPRYAVQP
ncbi:proline-rich protein 5-like isoform X2 [Pungitius pungitius]|uniref:proline-rich protein 5-like isoform X2 n=1 Tax=Pungitius pungitius TaxID=134920 RepID=UPI002E12A88C